MIYFGAFIRGALPHTPQAFFREAAASHSAKPLKRLDRNFKILCICPQAMPMVVIARGHLIFFSFLVKCAVYRYCSVKTLNNVAKVNAHLAAILSAGR